MLSLLAIFKCNKYMSIKCICFCRVSTVAQDLEAQKDKVYAEAKADGFKDEEIAIIEGKESAIKLKEEERETIREMKILVNDNPSIEAVYVFAIDRLARRVSVVLSVKDFLFEKGVNLVFLNPHKMCTLKVVNGIKKEDNLTNMLLMFLSYGAQMEMDIKKARFQVAKDSLKKQGKLTNGSLLFGYKKDEYHNAVIDESKAQYIRMIFNDYVNKEISTRLLYEKLVSLGLKKPSSRSASAHIVTSIIRDLRYSGRNQENSTYYQPIVSIELQDRAIKKLSEMRKKPKTTHKYVYYGKGLVRNKATGKVLETSASNLAYRCRDCGKSVSINVIDSIAWGMAIFLKQIDIIKESSRNRKEYLSQIQNNKKMIDNLNSLLTTIHDKQTKAFKLYLDGKVKVEIYEEQIKSIDNDEKKWTSKIAELESNNVSLQNFIDSIDTANAPNPQNFDSMNDLEKKQLIESVISSIDVTFLEDKPFRARIEIIPVPLLDNSLRKLLPNNYFIYTRSGGNQKVIQHFKSGEKEIEQSKPIEKRFIQRPRPDRHKNR